MRKLLGLSILTLLAVGLMLAVVGSASATPSFQGAFDSAYPSSPLVGQCAVCHTGAPSKATVNSYGSAFKASGFGAIESRDSDGDGVSNIDEIRAGFLPGLSSSTPPTTTAPPTTTNPPSTTAAPTTTRAPSTTQAPTTPAPPTTKAPTTTTVTPGGAMTETYDMDDAGRVTITFDGKRILAVDVAANDGWTCHVDEQSSDEVEIECRGFGQEVEFEAEIEHGTIKVDIETDDDDDAGDHKDDDGRNDDDDDDDDRRDHGDDDRGDDDHGDDDGDDDRHDGDNDDDHGHDDDDEGHDD